MGASKEKLCQLAPQPTLVNQITGGGGRRVEEAAATIVDEERSGGAAVTMQMFLLRCDQRWSLSTCAEMASTCKSASMGCG